MRVAFVSQPFDWVIPPHQNSIGICTYQVASRLARDHDVTVFLRRMAVQSHGDGSDIDFRFVRTMPSNFFWGRVQALASPFVTSRRPFFAMALYYADYGVQIAIALRRRAYDIVHIQNSPQFVPVIRALNPSIKIVLHMHCEWLSQLNRELIEKRLRAVDLVIGCSNHVTEKVRQRFPELASRCHTVFNGVDLDRFVASSAHTREEAPHVLFVGRISPEKGVHVLLDAFERVRRQFPNARLSLVGPIASAPQDFLVGLAETDDVARLAAFYQGDYIDHLNKLISAEARESVVFTGAIPYSELAGNYGCADVVVNPSLSESFGMSLIEAMACSRPVVAARVGGMIDIVQDGVTGRLVEPGDAGALADAIIGVLADPSRGSAMGVAGLQRVRECFSWDLVTADLAKRYEQLLHISARAPL